MREQGPISRFPSWREHNHTMKHTETTGKALQDHQKGNLSDVAPLIIQDHYEIDYRHSYAQDSPFFLGLSQGRLLGSRCTGCQYMYATPRSHCMECGATTTWEALPPTGRIHTFTVCYYGGESFLKETPFLLVLVEFDQVQDTLSLPAQRHGTGRGSHWDSYSSTILRHPHFQGDRCLVRTRRPHLSFQRFLP